MENNQITYEWEILSIDCKPKVNELEVVAYLVHWRCTATLPLHEMKTLVVSDMGQLRLRPPGPGFVPFNELTKDRVLSWFDDQANARVRIEDRLKRKIESKAKIRFQFLTPPLPWSDEQ